MTLACTESNLEPSVGIVVFSFDPPESRWKSPDAKRPGETDAHVSGIRRVLVVDDESNIADTLVEILNGEGYQAVSASDGNSAIELAKSFNPDLVISDVVIPAPNGVEAAIAIRELLPNCRIILFSGQSATVDLLRQARQQGHEFEIVAKPVKPQDLLALIRRTH